MLDSTDKGCENKGMRPKLPRLIHSLAGFTALVLGLFLTLASGAAGAAAERSTDHALFWSVQKDGRQAGYLLGTIHSEDPRVLDFSDAFLDRLRSNEVFAMEMVPDAVTLERLGGYMKYPRGQSLETVLGSERFDALESALSAYRVAPEFIRMMKPWAAMMTLSTPPPDTGFFMDLSLSLRASGNGLEVVGLETLEEQLSFLENMPMPMQLELLDQAIAESDRVVEVHDQMVNAYLQNSLPALQTLSDEQLGEVGADAKNYFVEFGIHARNRRMADSLLKLLGNRTVFAAVGALHLPGEQGLIDILRQHGYVLNPLPLPFAASPAKAP